MRIIIIGGTSSLGTALKKAVSEFSEVITAGRKNCDIILDLKDSNESIILPELVDAVIHTAAHFGGSDDKDLFDAEYINALGTLKLCQAAKRANSKHFILISSMFSSLNSRSRNFNIYALSKRHAEELAAFYCSVRDLPLTILRPSQLYGNGEEFRKHQPFFYNMIDKAEKGEDINLYGTHDPLRNYIHIDDLVQVIAKVIQQKIVGTYSCANINNVTYTQIAKAAFNAFNRDGKVSFLKDNPDIPDNVFELDSSLYETIGFYPRISIEEGIKRLANQRVSPK